MKTNLLISFLFFAFFVNPVTSQNLKKNELEMTNYRVHIFPDAFLVGSFSDYLGRFYYIEKETQIDRYSSKEKSLAKYISFFITNNYKVKNELVFKDDNNIELYVPNLAKRLHTNFYNGDGQIIYEKFVTDEEKLSFLLGVYYRYGEQLTDEIYQIKLVNSPKQKVIYELLKDLGCEKIVFDSTQDKLPQTFTFYFVATPKMIKYFDHLKQEKAQLTFETMSFIDDTNKDFENTSKKNQKVKKELIKNLEALFN
ncbi:hypothetical protein [Flavobacterium sp. I3-2]|uniref:hypothetical protein n=1 Tax=Flavobacterium sp. I3-2 TaxID=2748319 RepID=UPI0015B16B32|nr:hypothetical protein [Flavobacterium sp. I3-2]